MKPSMKITVAAAAVLATTLASFGSAEARKLYPRYHAKHHRAVVVGAAALTAGVVIGSTMARPRYVRPRTVIIRPAPVYVAPAPVIVDRRYEDELPVYDAPDYSDDRVYDDQDYSDYQGDYENDDPGYYPPAPRRHATEDRYQDQDRQAGALEPWSDEWRSFCAERYRTFNPRNGTYRGVDGRDHFCTAG